MRLSLALTTLAGALTSSVVKAQTIGEIAGSVEDLSTLVAALDKADLVDAVNGDGPMTVFAPINDAFDTVTGDEPELANALFEYDSWNTHLSDILTYHVLSGAAVASTDLVDGDITMLNNGTVTVDAANAIFTDELGLESTVVPDLFDVVADNGIVHVVDGVLLPAWVGTTIVDVAAAVGAFETVLELADQVSLAEVLAGFGDGEGYTLFAPLDSAFEGIDAEALTDEQITKILLDHVVVGPLTSSEVVGLSEIPTVGGTTLTVEVNDDGILIGGSMLNTDPNLWDIKAKNGMIHVMSEVILLTEDMVSDMPSMTPSMMPTMPLSTLAEIVASTDFLSTLLAAAEKAGLVDALNGPGPLTVFAPDDDAFAAVVEAAPDLANALFTFESWNFHLTDILLYHTIEGSIFSEDLTDGDVTMSNDGTLTIEAETATFTDELGLESTVVEGAFDIEASNGVAHVVDGVLLPAWVGTTIVDVAVEAGSFGTVLDLATQVGLDSVLAGYGDDGEGFTLFAPVDAAFEGIDAGSLTDEQITNILLDHVVVGPLPSAEVVGLTEVETARGNTLMIEVTEDGANIGGALIADVDIPANNGLIHVLQDVILVDMPVMSESPSAAPTMMTMMPSSAPSSSPTMMPTISPTTSKTIADIAGEVDELSSLVAAAAKAGLVDALAGPGPMTVFAPTNMAFGAVAAVEPELANAFFMFNSWNFHLADVLTYHVINGTAILSTDLVDGDVMMLNGGTVTVATNPVSFTDELSTESTVVPELFDVVASNGVVHVTDGVFLPAWVGTDIVDVALGAGSFGTVLALATQVGLDSVLKGFGETGEGYTLFAPVDAAFEGIDGGSLTDEQITNILLDHVVVGPLPSAEVVGSTMIETARGAMLEVVVDEMGVTIGGAALMTDMLDIKAKNGLIHVLSEVILVPATDAPTAAPTTPDAADTDAPTSSPTEESGAISFATTVVSTLAVGGAVASLLF